MTTQVLVIEDEPSILDNIIETLKLYDFTAVGAASGETGLQLARQHVPDLILCDVMIPDLDGYSVLLALRSEPATSLIPFIFLTALADRQSMRYGIELGADDYLAKPFTPKELIAAINTCLDKRAALREVADKKLDDLRQSLMLTLPHELRTPLTGILGYAELMISNAHNMPPERIIEMATRISNAGRRLFRLVENYQMYAQIEITMTNDEWVQALRTQCTPSPQLIVRDQAMVKARLANRDADLVLSGEEVPPTQISQHYLTKIVQELVDNAFKFSRTGTSVYAVATLVGDRCVIRVTNSGQGMTRDQIANIGAYMQFGRREQEQQGSGLGLVIVKRLAELHGGEMMIESVPDRQTVVSVSLPLAEAGC
jgi:signal transduction histidine kinase